MSVPFPVEDCKVDAVLTYWNQDLFNEIVQSFGIPKRLVVGDEGMTDQERLDQIKQRLVGITPGPWYPHATDDQVCMNARYVSTEPGPLLVNVKGEMVHDGKCGMDVSSLDLVNSESVVAITLLQSPRLVDNDHCDENTLFIAHAPDDMRFLMKRTERLLAFSSRLMSLNDTALDREAWAFEAAMAVGEPGAAGVYADWLEEHGFREHAAKLREMEIST